MEQSIWNDFLSRRRRFLTWIRELTAKFLQCQLDQCLSARGPANRYITTPVARHYTPSIVDKRLCLTIVHEMDTHNRFPERLARRGRCRFANVEFPGNFSNVVSVKEGLVSLYRIHRYFGVCFFCPTPFLCVPLQAQGGQTPAFGEYLLGPVISVRFGRACRKK